MHKVAGTKYIHVPVIIAYFPVWGVINPCPLTLVHDTGSWDTFYTLYMYMFKNGIRLEFVHCIHVHVCQLCSSTFM